MRINGKYLMRYALVYMRSGAIDAANSLRSERMDQVSRHRFLLDWGALSRRYHARALGSFQIPITPGAKGMPV